jgi:hypothetical protein
MTASGELYVDEECRDAFEKELNKWFGQNEWHLDGSPYSGTWVLADMPTKMDIDVITYDNDDKRVVLGVVEIINKFSIQEEMSGKYIDCTPKSIKLITKHVIKNPKIHDFNTEVDE